MFITDTQLAAYLKSALQKPDADFTTGYWPALVTQANLQAYNEILGRLAERGYSAAQIAAWDRGAEFQKALGAFFALTIVKANNPEQYSLQAIQLYDWRDQLTGNEQKNIKPVGVLNSGVWQDPDGPVGQPTTGAFESDGDLFGVPIDPDDARIDEIVRF